MRWHGPLHLNSVGHAILTPIPPSRPMQPARNRSARCEIAPETAAAATRARGAGKRLGPRSSRRRSASTPLSPSARASRASRQAGVGRLAMRVCQARFGHYSSFVQSRENRPGSAGAIPVQRQCRAAQGLRNHPTAEPQSLTPQRPVRLPWKENPERADDPDERLRLRNRSVHRSPCASANPETEARPKLR